MATAKRFAPTGEQRGEVELPSAMFGVEPNEHVMWEAVRNYLANQRQGTASVKNRRVISGGGRKPWRQKGTGRARAGTTRSPVMVGGARAFGPHPRDYGYALPKKVRRLALKSALSAKAGSGEVRIIEDFRVQEAKTREVARVMKSLELYASKCLLVVPEHDAALARAARNLPRLAVREYRLLNPYEVLHCDCLLVMESAVPKMEEAWGA
ncbi:MAG: 50S ribosomal protein L4 [Candidatus Eisenbacteria bacterium]|nr:50S ribosomal protein L4 [Candidatus Eisenbacteria bacterium]